MGVTPKRIYLSSPHMSGGELDYIHDAFEKNWIAPLGENVDGFERDLEAFTGRKHAAVVTSGTAAIHLGLKLCGVEAGDDVICQSFTFAATANPIRYLGANPVFVDSEPETWNMDPELLEKAILDRIQTKASINMNGEPSTYKDGLVWDKKNASRWVGKKPKAIIYVHLYGMPAKVDQIMAIAAKYDIPLIEDAAEALGSSINNRKCGTFGLMSVLSFNGNKIITTSGGGALLSDNKQLIEKARFLATQARDDAPHYQHSEIGYNYRMSNIVAGIGRGQIAVLEDRVRARRRNHNFYFNRLGKSWFNYTNFIESRGTSPTGLYFLKEPEGCIANRWLTTIVVHPGETGGVTRDDIRLALEAENIESRPLWKPMHLQPVFKGLPHYGKGISDFLFKHGLCLPSGSNLTDAERLRIVKVIKRTLKESPKSSRVGSLHA